MITECNENSRGMICSRSKTDNYFESSFQTSPIGLDCVYSTLGCAQCKSSYAFEFAPHDPLIDRDRAEPSAHIATLIAIPDIPSFL